MNAISGIHFVPRPFLMVDKIAKGFCKGPIDPAEAERSIQVLGVCGASPATLLFMQPLWLLHFIGAP